MNFVACAVEETGIDENHPRFGGANTFLQIHCGAAFLVHNAHFHAQCGQAKGRLNRAEQRIGKGHFFRPVHFRLHNIDRTGFGVFRRHIGFVEIMLRQKTGHHRIHNAFGNLITAVIKNGRIGH